MFLTNKYGKCNPISWQLKRKKRIARSTQAAEAIAMVEGVESAVYISVLLKELYPEIKNTPKEIYTDNKPLHDAL